MNVTHDSICQVELPTGHQVDILRRRFQGKPGPSVALVAGIRGNTPEGVRVLYKVSRLLSALSEITGTVDIYPCANPLAAHSGTRVWPFFDVDLNRQFPGRWDGHPPARVARALVEHVGQAEVVVEVKGSNPAFQEITQAHVRIGRRRELELASRANVEMVWARSPGPNHPSTFAAQFETVIALEGGLGGRLTQGVGQDLVAGVMNLIAVLGIIDEEQVPVHWAAIQRPTTCADEHVRRIRTEHGGVFLPSESPGALLQAGDLLGTVVDPMLAEELEIITAPVPGRIVAVRDQPLVHPGSMVARLLAVDGDTA